VSFQLPEIWEDPQALLLSEDFPQMKNLCVQYLDEEFCTLLPNQTLFWVKIIALATSFINKIIPKVLMSYLEHQKMRLNVWLREVEDVQTYYDRI